MADQRVVVIDIRDGELAGSYRIPESVLTSHRLEEGDVEGFMSPTFVLVVANQVTSNRYQEAMQLRSNIEKTKHDTVKNSISNIR